MYIYIYIYIIYIYIYITGTFLHLAHHFILIRLRLERDGGSSTLCYSSGFACQQRVLKTFPGPGYLRSEDGVA